MSAPQSLLEMLAGEAVWLSEERTRTDSGAWAVLVEPLSNWERARSKIEELDSLVGKSLVAANVDGDLFWEGNFRDVISSPDYISGRNPRWIGLRLVHPDLKTRTAVVYVHQDAFPSEDELRAVDYLTTNPRAAGAIRLVGPDAKAAAEGDGAA